MKLSEYFKQLKRVMPDEGYARRSRMHIVGMPVEVRPRLTAWSFLMQNLQIGSAIALTALLFVVGFGGFSAWKSLSPFRLASLDVTNLRAEAEAVGDIQVLLENVSYADAPAPVLAALPKTMRTTKPSVAASQTSAQLKQGTSSAQEPVSIDEALDILSQ